MQRSANNKFLLLTVLITMVIFSMGASSWLIINEQPGLPSYISKITPTLTIGGPYNIYEGEEFEFTNVSLVAQNGSGNVIFSKNDYTLSYETSALVFTPTTEQICTVQIEVTATPNDTQHYKEAKKTVSVNIYPVAQRGTTYYGTIESALDDGTSGTIEVLNNLHINPADPQSARYSPKIRRNVTIDAGEVLNIKYANEGAYDGNGTANPRNTAHRKGSAGNFADSTLDKVKENLKSEVTIKSGVTLTVKGVLNIGGILGKDAANGARLAGAASGNYSQITMEPNSYIEATESTAVIDCLGYIKESASNNGSRVTMTKGSLYMPFVIYNYGGGSHTVASFKAGGISPFSIFDMPNVQSKVRCYSNAKIVGYADLQTGELKALGITVMQPQHNQTDISVIGSSNSIINLTDGAYLDSKFTPSSPQITAESEEKARDSQGSTEITIAGGANLGAMTLKVSVLGNEHTVTTTDVYFPVPWKMNITLSNGNYDINYSTKFMSGSTLTVNQNATLNIGSKVIFYPSGITSPSPSNYPAGKERAKFNIKGTVNVSSSASLAGFIENGTKGGELNIQTSALSLTSVEGTGDVDRSDYGKLLAALRNPDKVAEVCTFTAHTTVSETATANTFRAGETALSTNTYYSNGNEWYTLGEKTITYNSNGGSAIASRPINVTNTDGTGYRLTEEDLTASTKAYYTFAGWYYDSSLSDESKANVGDEIFGNITLYAKWTPKTYTINFVPDNGLDNYSETFTYTPDKGGSSLPTHPKTNGFDFGKWYIDEALTTDVSTYNEALSHISGSNTSITLYGSWVGGYVVQFNINTSETFEGTITETYINEGTIDEIKTHTFPGDLGKSDTKYFDGWYYEGAKVTDWSFLKAEETKYTIEARWNNKYHLIVNEGSSGATKGTPINISRIDEYLMPDDLASRFNQINSTATAKDTDIGTDKYFVGWTSSSGTTITELTTSVFTNYELTLTANWGQKYTLTITAKGSKPLFRNYSAYISITDSGENSVEAYTNSTTENKNYAYIKPGQTVTLLCAFEKSGGKLNGTEVSLSTSGGTFGGDCDRSYSTSITIASDATYSATY